MQRIERDTIHRIADELVIRQYDETVVLSTSYDFSAWVFEFAGDEDWEQRLYDEQDEMTGLLYELAKKYGIEVYEE
jgi:hypothetical protein